MRTTTSLPQAGGLAALLALSLSAGGCDKTPPFRAAQTAFGDDIALLAAYAPLVRTQSKAPLDQAVAYVAMAKLVPIGKHAQEVPEPKDDGLSPTALLRSDLSSLATLCATTKGASDEESEKVRELCSKAIDLFDDQLASIEKRATAAGMPAGSFPKLAAAATPAAQKKSEPLTKALERTADEKAFADARANPKIGAPELGEACQKALASRKSLKSADDPDLDALMSKQSGRIAADCMVILGLRVSKSTATLCTASASPPPTCWGSRMCDTLLAVVDPPATFADLIENAKKNCKK